MQCRLCYHETFLTRRGDSTFRQVKAPAASRHTQSYLQCTTMGPASVGLQALTRRRKARIGVGYSGTPWSGQAMNWNCRSSVFSLEPFCQRQRGVVLHENISSQCRKALIGQQEPQARKALCDDACTGLSPVKIWRKTTGLLQSSYPYRGSVERQFYRQQSISAGVEQTVWKV